MERQDLFGVQSTSTIDDATAEFLLGNSGAATSKPEDLSPIEDEGTEEDKKKKSKEKATTVLEDDTVKVTEDDIFGKEEVEEKTTDTTKPEKKVPETKPEEKQEDSVNINFESLVNSLSSLGIISPLEEGEEIKTDEQLAAKFQKDASIRANQEIYKFLSERHGQDGIDSFEAIYVNGMNPKDYFGQYNEIQSLKELDITSESNQEKVLQEYYRRQGLSDDKITKKLERVKNYGDLEDEARDAHELLVQQEEEEFQAKLANQAEKEKQAKASRQQYLNNLNTILAEKLKSREFDGIPVTEKVAKETIDYLYTEKWKTPTGEKLTDFDKDILELKNPKNHSLKIKLALLLRNGLDLSKIKVTPEITKKTNKLFEGLVMKETVTKRDNPTHSSGSFI